MSDSTKTWGIWIVRGLASLAFGNLTIWMPEASIRALVFVFGAYAVVDGAVLLGVAFREEHDRGMYVLRGLLGVATGLITFAWPGLTALSLYVLIAAWALSAGVLELVVAIKLRDRVSHLGGLAVTGVLLLALGVIMLALPLVGVTALVGVIAVYSIVNGITAITIGMRIRLLVPSRHDHAPA